MALVVQESARGSEWGEDPEGAPEIVVWETRMQRHETESETESGY